MSKRLNENLGRALSPCRISISRVTEGLSLESVHICVSPCRRVASVRVQLVERAVPRRLEAEPVEREMCDGRVHFLFLCANRTLGHTLYALRSHTDTREAPRSLQRGSALTTLTHYFITSRLGRVGRLL